MAFYNQDEDEEGQAQNGQATGPQSGTIQGQGAASTPATASTNAPTNNPSQYSPDKPGNFTGISTYLNANKPQAAKLGDQASGVINNSANQARQSLSGLNDIFNNQASAQQVNNDAEASAMAKTNAEKLSDMQKEQIKKQANAQYTGPTDLTSIGDQYGKTLTDINTAKQNVSMSGTEEGRQGLVKQINAAPRTAGMTNFDSILLQSGDGREKLAQASEANKDLNEDLLGGANSAAMQRASDIKSANDLLKSQTRDDLLGAQSGLYDSLNKKASDRTSNEYKQYQDILNRFNNKQMTASDLDFLGIPTSSVTGGIYGTLADKVQGNDLGSTLGGRYNAGNVAGDEERARQAALQDLMSGFGDESKNVSFTDKIGDEDAYSIRGDAVKSAKDAFNNYSASAQSVSDIGGKLGLKDAGAAQIIAAGLTEPKLKQQLAGFTNGRPQVVSGGLNGSIEKNAQIRYDTIKALLENTKAYKTNNSLLSRLSEEERGLLTYSK